MSRAASNAKETAAKARARSKLKTIVQHKEALRSEEIVRGAHKAEDLNTLKTVLERWTRYASNGLRQQAHHLPQMPQLPNGQMY